MIFIRSKCIIEKVFISVNRLLIVFQLLKDKYLLYISLNESFIPLAFDVFKPIEDFTCALIYLNLNFYLFFIHILFIISYSIFFFIYFILFHLISYFILFYFILSYSILLPSSAKAQAQAGLSRLYSQLIQPTHHHHPHTPWKVFSKLQLIKYV